MNEAQLEILIKEMRRLETKVQTINERTKSHTKDIRELRKEIKELPHVRTMEDKEK